MRHTDTIEQVNGTRRLFRCPRGTVAVDILRGRGPEETALGNEARLTRRDLSDALRMSRELTAADERAEREQY